MLDQLFEPVTAEDADINTCSQVELETYYSKYQLHHCIAEWFIKENFDKEFIDEGICPKFGIDLLVQMELHKRADVPTLVGILMRHFTDTLTEKNKIITAEQLCADEILKAIDADFVDHHEMSGKVIVKYEVDKEVRKKISRFMYPLPMVEPPAPVRNNYSTGYYTIKKSLILKNNHHEDNLCLDHINRCNNVALSLNENVVAFVQNKWRNHDKRKEGETREEFDKRKKAFHTYDTTSRDVLAALIAQGNHFWLTHRYDKRGRTYSQGYHVNYQGNDWNKACIEFADAEVLNQEGQCYHCAYPLHKDPPAHLLRIEIKEELFPENFFDHPVHLHHDHNTGETLGAVHARCNAILWQYYGE
jgi:hypothetical protein